MWYKLYLAVCAALLIGTCSMVLAAPVLMEPESEPPMRLYTPSGYETRWWVFEDIGHSCVVVYSIRYKGTLVDTSQIPCQMFGMFFKSIKKRPGA